MKKLTSLSFIFLATAFFQLFAAPITGKLFIIGGGKVNESMRDQMIKAASLDKGGYMVILPMSSEEPEVNIEETQKIFKDTPWVKIFPFNIHKGDQVSQACLDSIRNARLVFISGGDQVRFLDVIAGTGIKEAIDEAYRKKAVIAGTSAGASLMSKIMVTGNEIKHPEDGSFKTIEAGNVETKEGLGFLKDITIDQHFVVRKRLNRMLAYGTENRNHISVGIDEATAIYVEGNKATVFGISQVIVLHNKNAVSKVQNGLIGVTGLTLDIYLPGDSFSIE